MLYVILILKETARKCSSAPTATVTAAVRKGGARDKARKVYERILKESAAD